MKCPIVLNSFNSWSPKHFKNVIQLQISDRLNQVAEPLGLPVSSRFHADFTEKVYCVQRNWSIHRDRMVTQLTDRFKIMLKLIC